MTIQRDPDAILAAWLEEGPNRLPDATRRAIAVSTRTTHQSRLPDWLPWRAPTHEWNDPNSPSRRWPSWPSSSGDSSSSDPGPIRREASGGPGSPAPSRRHRRHRHRRLGPASPEPSVGAMTQAFTSPTFGYSIRYPAGWTVTPTTGEGPTPGGADELRLRGRGLVSPRACPVAVPDGVVVDDWIRQTLQQSDDPGCMPPTRHLGISDRRRPRRPDPGLLW